MNKPHPRSPSVIRRPHLGSIPAIHEQALERRQSSMRSNGPIARPTPRARMPRAATALPRLTLEIGLVHESGRPGRTNPAVTSTSRLDDLAGGELRQRDSGHGGVVGAQARREG